MTTKTYDFIMAGGGVAGLSLAYALTRSPHFRNSSILVVDKSDKSANDCTLSFWTGEPTPFEGMVYRSWKQVQFVGENFARTVDMEDYRYQMIRGGDFYRFVRQQLKSYPNVEFLHGTVNRIEDGDELARVWVDQQSYTGKWVFDSRLQWSALPPDSEYHQLKLHFMGWEIETLAPAFNPQTVTLLDFRTPQQQESRFFYVLPLSERRALVEFTLFAKTCMNRKAYTEALQNYIETTMELKEYHITRQEKGVIPITDRPFPRRAGQRIMNIGTPGGRIKPSTGYAFCRIQQDTAGIIRSLEQAGHPFAVPPDSRRYRFYDSLMLYVMTLHGAQIKPIFTALFRHNPIKRVFRFLDEQASLAENVLLISTLPPGLFLKALFQLKIWRQIISSVPEPVVNFDPEASSV